MFKVGDHVVFVEDPAAWPHLVGHTGRIAAVHPKDDTVDVKLEGHPTVYGSYAYRLRLLPRYPDTLEYYQAITGEAV